MSRRVVLDASAAIHAVLPGAAAEPVLDAVGSAAVVFAPDLYCLEVGSALWKYVRARHISSDDAFERLERALALVDTLVPDAELAKESLTTASASGLTVYDAAYVVLAKREGATLLTADLALARALAELKVPVLAVEAPDAGPSGRRRRR